MPYDNLTNGHVFTLPTTHLPWQIFRRRVEEENRAQHMFNNDVTTQMFLNIQSIHQFHREHLLPELEARLNDWDNNPRIGELVRAVRARGGDVGLVWCLRCAYA